MKKSGTCILMNNVLPQLATTDVVARRPLKTCEVLGHYGRRGKLIVR